MMTDQHSEVNDTQVKMCYLHINLRNLFITKGKKNKKLLSPVAFLRELGEPPFIRPINFYFPPPFVSNSEGWYPPPYQSQGWNCHI